MQTWKRVLLIVVCVFSLSLSVEFYLQNTQGLTVDQVINSHLYDEDQFCEERFLCHSNKKNQYDSFVNLGYKRMKGSKVIFCGLARDISDNIHKISRRIEDAGSKFLDYKVLIFENDSADNTRDLLHKWQNENQKIQLIETDVKDCKFGVQKLYNFGPFSSDRISRMAYFRNYYLNIVKEQYKDFDFMIVVDMDLKGPWSLDGIANSIGHDNWDAIGSYGLMAFPGFAGALYAMYDVLAYVPCDEDIDTKSSAQKISMDFLRLNLIDLVGVSKGSDMIPVKSCFAGLGIYKIKSIENIEYKGGRCEHIEFHRQMIENGNGKIFMNPSQLIMCGHQGPRNFTTIFRNDNAQPLKLTE